MTATQESETEARIVSAEDVVAFLRNHPGFLNENPDLLSELDPPTQRRGRGVYDFQEAMIRRLRDRVEESSEVARDLIDTSRDNMHSQSRIHDCVLRMIGANSFAELVGLIQNDVAVILDVDLVVLAVEADPTFQTFPTGDVTIVPPGFVDRLLDGPDRDLLLRSHVSGDPDIYGAAASLVQSDALIRLTLSPSVTKAMPKAMMIFGHRDPEKFHTGQATELIAFLSSVSAELMRLWLSLSDVER